MLHSLAASLLSIWPVELVVVLAAVSIALIKPESAKRTVSPSVPTSSSS